MARRGDRAHDVVLWTMSLAVAVLVAWVVWHGRSFYLTSLADRPHHPDFRDFRSAGRVGHGVGILGSAMVLVLLLYSLRKRWKPLARAGQLRHWLRYHIFLGVAGPVLITLHTAFKVDGLVAVSYWSMVAVALSGVFGRYLYQQIPRNVLGEALAPDAVEQRNEAILVELAEQWGADQKALDALDRLALKPLEGRPRRRRCCCCPCTTSFWRGVCRNGPGCTVCPTIRTCVDLARQWALAARRLHLFHLVRDLFHWWHVFHKPFAIIMILVMIVHVAVAVALGYTWTFGGEA